jgi:hypothetical protein
MKPTGAVFLIPFLAFLAIACSRNSGDHEYYGNIGLSGGGVITNAAVSPVDEDILSVSTNMSGFFLSYEGPKHWNMVHQSQVRYSRCAPCFHPVDPAVIFAPGHRGLVVSRDSGRGDCHPSRPTGPHAGRIARTGMAQPRRRPELGAR